jgi:hypothetical protein
MAVTQLTDIYVAEPFQHGVDQAATEKNAFLQSGIMVESPLLSGLASQGGYIGEIPFYNPLTTLLEPNYTTDNPADVAVPENISTGKQIYRLASMHNAWSTMDLTRELAMRDPLGAIAGKIGGWWATQIQRRVISTCLGILADNVANDGSDMLKNVANDNVLPINDAELISPDVILDAAQTMGDAKDALAAIALHSVVYTRLQKLGFIDLIQPQNVNINIPVLFNQYRVIVDDGLPAVVGANRTTYTSILFANGALDAGRGTVMKPSELERAASVGNGGGQDIIHSRRADIIHPSGFSFLSAAVVGQSATLAELANALNWNRVWDRKAVGMAFLKTNG